MHKPAFQNILLYVVLVPYLVFKHFVTHGPDSVSAAIASQCANEQGKFWNFYKILYGNQGEEKSGWANPDNLKICVPNKWNRHEDIQFMS